MSSDDALAAALGHEPRGRGHRWRGALVGAVVVVTLTIVGTLWWRQGSDGSVTSVWGMGAPRDVQDVTAGTPTGSARATGIPAPAPTDLATTRVPMGVGGLELRVTDGKAALVDPSGAIVGGQTETDGALGGSAVVGSALVMWGTAPTSLAEPRVFFVSLAGVQAPGGRKHALEVPTFRVDGDDRTWYALVDKDPRGHGLFDTTSGFAYAGSDGTVTMPGCGEAPTCDVGPDVLPEIRSLLAAHPAG